MHLSVKAGALSLVLLSLLACGGPRDGTTQSNQPADAGKAVEQARKSYQDGKVDLALSQFNTAIAEGAASAAAYGGRGAAEMQTGDWQAALTDLDRAVALDPKNDIYLENRAITLTELFKKDGDRSHLPLAISSADQAVRLKPDRVGPIYARGEAYFLNGEHENALADMQECVGRSGRFQRAWLLKGKAEAALGKTGDARASFNKLVELDPNGQMGAEAKVELEKLG